MRKIRKFKVKQVAVINSVLIQEKSEKSLQQKKQKFLIYLIIIIHFCRQKTTIRNLRRLYDFQSTLLTKPKSNHELPT
jgi:hypothetical protein